MEIERFEQIKENHKHNKKMLELNSPSQYIEINESELEDIGWLISTVEVLQKLVNYHQKKQKEAEDENEPYRHENARLREALEFYAETDNYGWEISFRPQQEIDCMVIDDGGHTARKALENDTRHISK